MLQRGRKSSAKLAILQTAEGPTLPCPSYFGDEQKKLWDQIVGSTGPDWFPVETHPLLEQYVCLSIEGRRPDITTKERISISLTMTRLASNMRISQFASYEKPKRKGVRPRPIWQNTGD